MLDNLGFGEFFFLALLALLFFGPERLPSIGARIGGWVRSLTQYSSAFLNEWRDEALAVRDAVEQVKGIRDEIVAAQAEITGTLEMARSDASDAVSGARHDVRQQIQHSTQVLPDDTSHPAAVEEAGEDVAIAKTQEILGSLLAQDSPQERVAPEDAPATPAAPPTPPAQPAHVSPADVEQLRNQVAVLQEEMDDLRTEVARYRARTQPRTRGETSAGEQGPATAERTPEASPQAVAVGEPV